MADILDEAQQDLKQEKLELLWQENRNFIIGSIIFAILLTASLSYWRNWDYQQKMDATTGYYHAFKSNDVDTILNYADSAKGDHAALAHLSAAGVLFKKGRNDDAVNQLRAVQAESGADKMYRDLAAIMEASHLLNSADPAALEKKLLPLSSGSAWSLTAQEFLAVLAARQKDFDKAVQIFDNLLQKPDLPQDMRSRIEKLGALYAIKKAEKNASLQN
ncbi:MAG: tetratricopeptide repeat protein [Pseudomonadota bacterium]|nr:hypothetical protein [Pseudomonadota bacterium]QKK05838.1 MAG: tetratricopeptide repeat protein [Pseudomonadota bacterium]